MKVGSIQYLFLAYPCTHQLFASSFMQGAHSNTAIRRHYYNANTLQNARTLLAVESHARTPTTRTSRLYGFLNNNNDNNNNEDEHEDEDEHPFLDSDLADLDNARKSFEAMFTIPKDKKRSKKSSSSYSPTATTISEGLNANMNIENDMDMDADNTGSNNKDKDKQRDVLIKTRDISRIANSIPQPPLTAIAHDRRLKEISLLATLTDSDEAVNDLWALWIAEKGPAAATLLLRSEQLMSVDSFDEAEAILWSIIRQHGIHWAEPVNRLATLKYMQGRLEESKKLCELVLRVKPWHFGALSGIVLVCTAMNDATGARMWADRRLPPLIPEHTSGDRRVKWISRALEDATEKLDHASKIGRSGDIGQEEAEFRTFRARMQHLNMEGGAHSSNDDNSSSTSFDDLDAWQ